MKDHWPYDRAKISATILKNPASWSTSYLDHLLVGPVGW